MVDHRRPANMRFSILKRTIVSVRPEGGCRKRHRNDDAPESPIHVDKKERVVSKSTLNLTLLKANEHRHEAI